jgi:hypothetical protein
MRNAIILFTLVVLSFGTQAAKPKDATKNAEVTKTADSKRWKKGFIVTLKGDTVEGKIKTPDFLVVYYDFQRVVSFKDQKGLSQYSPNDLKSFSFYEEANNSNVVTLQSVSSPDGTGRAFLKSYKTGPCKVYGMTVKEVKGNTTASGSESSSLISREKKYIQIQNSQFFPLKRAGFKKHMKEVFASCPHILAGLNSGTYTYRKWQTLVKDYNKEYTVKEYASK